MQHGLMTHKGVVATQAKSLRAVLDAYGVPSLCEACRGDVSWRMVLASSRGELSDTVSTGSTPSHVAIGHATTETGLVFVGVSFLSP